MYLPKLEQDSLGNNEPEMSISIKMAVERKEEWIDKIIEQINNDKTGITSNPIPWEFSDHIQREEILRRISAKVNVDIIRVVDFAADVHPWSNLEPFRKYIQTIRIIDTKIEIYRKALRDIMHEVGVPSCNYTENIINVYKIAKNALGE